MKNHSYIRSVWAHAVAEAEGNVMRACPSLRGGRLTNESAETYAERCMKTLDMELDKLREARTQLLAAKSAEKEGNKP